MQIHFTSTISDEIANKIANNISAEGTTQQRQVQVNESAIEAMSAALKVWLDAHLSK